MFEPGLLGPGSLSVVRGKEEFPGSNTWFPRPFGQSTFWSLSNTHTNIVGQASLIALEPVRFSYKILLPAYSDNLASDLGLLDADLPRDQFRVLLRINPPVLKHAHSADFSNAIRSRIPI